MIFYLKLIENFIGKDEIGTVDVFIVKNKSDFFFSIIQNCLEEFLNDEA